MNKKYWCLVIAGVMMTAGVSAQTVNNNETSEFGTPFLTTEEWPDHAQYIMVPPAADSMAYMVDAYYYQWGKQQRPTEKGKRAAIDESLSPKKAFGKAAGIVISKEHSPEIYKLVEGVREDARGINARSKIYFNRLRPFVYYREPSLIPEGDKLAENSASYPSGHATRGWVYALTLALVVPDSTESIIRRAQEFALNRVICGRHYKSDIDASLVEATAIMTRLLSNEAFLAQLQRAREEYQRIKKR